MTPQKSRRLLTDLALLVAIIALPLLPAYSDTITLKNGNKLEGKITLEAADFLKIELARSGSIKETKLVKRADIATIAKTNPDELALADIKKSLPTRSMMTSSSYQSLIQTGPEAFLTAYPDSLHKPEVTKILGELNAEKAKVDRGAIKLEGEWIDAEKRRNFKTLINSRIRLYSMKQKAASRAHTSALRDFQIIEDQFVGTPAYPKAVKIALSILPTYGQLLTRQLKDAEFLNKKREADIKLLPPENQARTQAAYKKEQDRFKALAEQEKKTGVKWRSVNRRNKDSITPMIDTVRKEIDELGKIDTVKLAAQAKLLIKVDELINENKLKEAEEKLIEAGGKASSKKRKSSGKKGRKAKSTYSDDLSKKIAYKIQVAETAAENATISAKAKKVAASISQGASKMTGKSESAADKDAAQATNQAAADAMDAAMAAREKASEAKTAEAEAKTAVKKPKSTKKKKKKKSSSKVASDSGGGGINFQFLLIGFVVVMGIVIVVLKKMGIGGGKADGGGDGE